MASGLALGCFVFPALLEVAVNDISPGRGPPSAIVFGVTASPSYVLLLLLERSAIGGHC